MSDQNDEIYTTPDTELKDYIPVRSSFDQASKAAKEFSTKHKCDVRVARREPPLSEYWLILAPYMHVVHYAEQYERDSSREPTGEVARIMDYEAQLAKENEMGGFDNPWWQDDEEEDV